MNTTVEDVWIGFAEQLRRFIRSRVSDPGAAEDLLQDVFVKVQKGLDRIEDSTRIQGWVYRIARNAVIDYYRTRKETVEVPDELAIEAQTGDADIRELKAAFRRMIDSLPEPYREALVLTEIEGLSQQELADRAGISLSGAKSRVQRGRERLREMLDACCTFEFDRRGKVIDCTPRGVEACGECGSVRER